VSSGYGRFETAVRLTVSRFYLEVEQRWEVVDAQFVELVREPCASTL
jgi:hypothetical protein